MEITQYQYSLSQRTTDDYVDMYCILNCLFKGGNNPISILFITKNYRRKEGNVLFNDALNTFYLWLYGVRHMVKDHSDREKGNLLPAHMLLFPINSKVSFICIIPQTG